MILLTQTVPPTTFPVSRDEAKAQLRIMHASEDVLVDRLIQAASRAIGEMAGRVLTAETWDLSIDAGQSGQLVLPKSPVRSVSSISFFDSDDVQQSASVSDFYLVKDDDRAALCPKSGVTWPEANPNRGDAITVTFVAGYTSCPDTLKQAVLMLVGHFYRNREAVTVGQAATSVPLAVTELVALERLGWFGA